MTHNSLKKTSQDDYSIARSKLDNLTNILNGGDIYTSQNKYIFLSTKLQRGVKIFSELNTILKIRCENDGVLQEFQTYKPLNMTIYENVLH